MVILLAKRHIWGGPRQYYLTVPKRFAEGHREVAVFYTKDYVIVVPVEKLAERTPCEVVEEVLSHVCLAKAWRESSRGG